MEGFGLEKIFNTIGSALNVFDFSFFISGSVTLSIIVVDLVAHIGNQWIESYFQFPTWIVALSLLLSVYVCGLVSWSIGRIVREKGIFNEKGNNGEGDFICTYNEIVNSMKLSNFDCILNIPNKTDAYSYMWIKLDSVKDNANIKSHLDYCRRLWVMRALFEGLMFSWFLAALAIIDVSITERGFLQFDVIHIISCLVGLIFLIVFSNRIARNYARSQLKDVIIAYFIYILHK